MLRLYHGTTSDFAKNIYTSGIDVSWSNHTQPDFGTGFYTTPDSNYALKCALHKAKVLCGRPAMVEIVADLDKMNKIMVIFGDDLRWGAIHHE